MPPAAGPRRPTVVAFDMIETTFSLEPVRARLVQAGADGRDLELLFARMLRDAFALTVAGDYRDFRAVAAGGVRSVLPAADDGAVAGVLAGFGELTPQPDAEPAMRLLCESGVRVTALTNGSAANTNTLLGAAGLDRYVEQVATVAEAGVWKPAPSLYRHGAARAGVAPAQMALVAVHSWDVYAAQRVGLTGGWCSRLERVFTASMGAPDVAGDSLVEVAERLLALPG